MTVVLHVYARPTGGRLGHLTPSRARRKPRPALVGCGSARGGALINVAHAPAWIGFASAAQVVQLRRMVTKKGKKAVFEIAARYIRAGKLDHYPSGGTHRSFRVLYSPQCRGEQKKITLSLS